MTGSVLRHMTSGLSLGARPFYDRQLSTISNTSLEYSIRSVQLRPLPSDDLEEDFGDDMIFSGEDEVDSEASEETKVYDITAFTHTMESLYCRHLGDLMKCPV